MSYKNLRNLNKSLSDTAVRIGECRFSYVNVFTPRAKEDGTPGKYSVQLIIPKTDKVAKAMIDAAVEAAYGVDFGGDEEKIVAHLFKLYAELTAENPA